MKKNLSKMNITNLYFAKKWETIHAEQNISSIVITLIIL